MVVCLYVWVREGVVVERLDHLLQRVRGVLVVLAEHGARFLLEVRLLVLQVLEAVGLDLDDLGQRRLAGQDVVHGQVVGGEGVRVGAHLLDDVVVRLGAVGASVPRNIMCSKKWAKPVLPGSTSLRQPVRTTE